MGCGLSPGALVALRTDSAPPSAANASHGAALLTTQGHAPIIDPATETAVFAKFHAAHLEAHAYAMMQPDHMYLAAGPCHPRGLRAWYPGARSVLLLLTHYTHKCTFYAEHNPVELARD